MTKRTQVLFNFFLAFYLFIMLVGILDGLFSNNQLSAFVPSLLVLILFVMVSIERFAIKLHFIEKFKHWLHH